MWHVAIAGSVGWSAAVLIGERGNEIYHSRGNGIQWREMYQGGPNFEILNLLTDLAQQVGMDNYKKLTAECDNCTVAIAGLDARYDTNTMITLLTKIGFLSSNCFMSSVSESSHAGSFMSYPGVILRYGHGSSAYAQKSATDKGKVVGGWGMLVADPACGYGLGMQAMRTLGNVKDGSTDKSEINFSENMLSITKLSDTMEVFERLEWERTILGNYGAQLYLGRIAQYTIDLYVSKDPHATRLIQLSIDLLVSRVRSSIGNWYNQHYTKFPLCVRGSLIERNPDFCKSLVDRVVKEIPQITVLDNKSNGLFNSVVGAGLLSIGNGKFPANNPRATAFIEESKKRQDSFPLLRQLP